MSACWPCNLGPATADAILARDNPSRVGVVVASFDRAIAAHQIADGSFVGDDNAGAIDTAFFVPELGTALASLGARISEATRRLWSRSIVRGAEYLIRSHSTTFYVNGNINLAYTEVLYLAWRVSREARFARAYNESWQFLVSPPRDRWAGYGLVVTRRANDSAPARVAGYLTESDGGRPGFDPEYTQLQLDTAASLFALSHDPRALTLMNLLMNQELPRVSDNLILNATDGSRHSLYTPFLTSALALLARYKRPDLASRLPYQTAQLLASYRNTLQNTSPNYYFGLSRWFAPVLVDSAGVPVARPPT
ncbi:MAG: hypothetical protein ACLPV4_04310 [Solirubrobacteraceae bacterium]